MNKVFHYNEGSEMDESITFYGEWLEEGDIVIAKTQQEYKEGIVLFDPNEYNFIIAFTSGGFVPLNRRTIIVDKINNVKNVNPQDFRETFIAAKPYIYQTDIYYDWHIKDWRQEQYFCCPHCGAILYYGSLEHIKQNHSDHFYCAECGGLLVPRTFNKQYWFSADALGLYQKGWL